MIQIKVAIFLLTSFGHLFSQDYAKKYLNDFELLSLNDHHIVRNEIFARHGYIFNDKSLRAYFSSKKWYIPLKHEIGINELYQVEKELLEKLINHKKEVGKRIDNFYKFIKHVVNKDYDQVYNSFSEPIQDELLLININIRDSLNEISTNFAKTYQLSLTKTQLIKYYSSIFNSQTRLFFKKLQKINYKNLTPTRPNKFIPNSFILEFPVDSVFKESVLVYNYTNKELYFSYSANLYDDSGNKDFEISYSMRFYFINDKLYYKNQSM